MILGNKFHGEEIMHLDFRVISTASPALSLTLAFLVYLPIVADVKQGFGGEAGHI